MSEPHPDLYLKVTVGCSKMDGLYNYDIRGGLNPSEFYLNKPTDIIINLNCI